MRSATEICAMLSAVPSPQVACAAHIRDNSALAEAMKGLDLINRYGYGIQRAQATLAENGNPPLEFAANPGAFVVTLRPRRDE